MSKTLADLVQNRHIPEAVHKKMGTTEAGILASALEDMVYNRSHDDKMHSVYAEKCFIVTTPAAKYIAGKLGFDVDDKFSGAYIKSDALVARVIELLDALALQEVLKEVR